MALPGTKGRRRIYLMRHGHVSYVNDQGQPVDPKTVSLTSTGRDQAGSAQQLLADIPIDRVICSGMNRARETAEIVLGPRSCNIEDVTAFREIQGGRLSQVSAEEREAAFVYGLEGAHLPNARFAGGDSFREFEQRVGTGFEDLLRQPDWKYLLLVTHDVVNRMILAHCCGAGLKGLSTFEQDMACINVVDVDLADGEVIRRMIKAVNVTPYNTSKAGMYRTSFEEVFRTLIKF